MAITNTGIVERVITGVNESDLFLDSEATSVVNNTGIVERSVVGVNTSETPFWRPTESDSVVNNTGIVERPISGVNESDPMFPNNTISNIINLAGNLLIALFEAFKTRVSTDGGTLDNEVGLDTDNFDDTSSLTMLPNAYKDGTLYSVLPEDGTGDFDVVRGSGATRIDSLGNISEVSNNTPRIDYTSGSPVLLVEPQSTNLLPYSEDLTNWANSASTLTNGLTSPSGDNSAYSVLSGAGASDRLSFITTLTAVNTQHTMSAFVKQVGGFNTAYLRWGHSELSNNIATFAFDTEVLTNVSGNSTDLFVENYGNGWYRVGFTFTTGATITNQQLQVNRGANVTAAYWGIQIEELSYATSYIPTTGVIATRLADSVTGAGDASTFNSTEGVLYFEGTALSNGGSNRIISLSDGTNDNLVYIRIDSTASRLRCFARGGAGSYTSALKSGISQTDNNKIAVSWDNTNLKMYINGSLAASSSINNLPVGLDRVSFTSPTGGDTFEGKVKDLRTYNTALTDAELLTLTTI